MTELSRRDLLRMAALGLGAVALDGVLGACKAETRPLATPTDEPSDVAEPTEPTEAESPAEDTAPTSAELESATPGASAGASASAGYPDLVVVRQGEPEPLVRRAIETLGGMERFVSKGSNVVVKPNVCVAYRTYDYAATTNPWVVGTLVKMAFEAGAGSVKVMDYPYGGAGAAAYANSGIAGQVQAAGGQMVVMAGSKYKSVSVPKGKYLKHTQVYEDILSADVLINAPIAKRHGSAGMTAAMKNLMGIVRDRQAMHGSLSQAIADLCTLIKPQLVVVDAVRILTSHGPSGGKLSYVKKRDTVIAGTDPVAADAFTAGLFGLRPTDLEYIKIGAAMGLGRSDLSKVRIQDIAL